MSKQIITEIHSPNGARITIRKTTKENGWLIKEFITAIKNRVEGK